MRSTGGDELRPLASSVDGEVMPKIGLDVVGDSTGCNYPHPFKDICLGSTWKKLGASKG